MNGRDTQAIRTRVLRLLSLKTILYESLNSKP